MHNNRTSISLKSNVEIKQTLVIISLKGRGLLYIPAGKGTATLTLLHRHCEVAMEINKYHRE